MTAIRVIFDGRAFVPQQQVSLPPQSEGLVIIQHADPAAQAQLDSAVRAYYEGLTSRGDAEDEAWGNTIGTRLPLAWDED